VLRNGVLVTGVTGFVGSALARSLSQDGVPVSGLARDPEAARRALGSAIVSAYRPDAASQAITEVRAVVHLAGESVSGLWTAKKRERIHRSRVEGTRKLVSAIERAEVRPDVLVSASAVGYYGDVAGDVQIDEEHPAGTGFLADVCVAWEREAMRAEELGVRVVRLRFGIVLGEGGALAAMLPPFKLGLGGPMGSGRQYMPWIHVDDAVRMIRAAIDDASWSGAYNAAATDVVSQGEFAKTLGAVLNRPAFMPAPAFALRSVLGDFASELLASRRIVPRRALERGFTFRFPELEPALREILQR
jgi:uncharacterized protein (TIGR01777 family)